ncbi:MAG: hypothetical protein RBT71_02460 [Flavobacteriales bacterium]|jgi:gliding motility-associated lipoprotein GldD|nr:hypothetical protein [Flavobacteriales bacterium]
MITFRRHGPWPLLAPLAMALFLAACAPDPVPKPRSYFRIDLPEQAYQQWPGDAFRAEVPTYGRMGPVRTEGRSRWYDLRFPGQRATLHLTYSRIDGDLHDMIEDAHTFKGKHEEMAARVDRDRVLRPDAHVYGTVFNVEGDVASPLVFYLTDSTDHFLYGSLYFHARPNADSLAPVTDRIRADVRHMIATLEWTAATP